MRQCLPVKNRFSVYRLFLFGWIFLFVCGVLPKIAAADAQTAENPKDQIRQAQKLMRRGELSEAEKILRRVVAVNPQNSDGKLALAYVLMKEKRIVEAYEQSLAVAQSEPKNAHAFAVLGSVYLAAGNFSESRLLVNQSLGLDKRDALAWATIGTINFYENKLKESLTELRNAAGFDSKEPDFIYTLAQVATRAEEYKEASAAYRRFLEISPPDDEDRRERIKGLIRFLTFLGSSETLYSVSGNKEEKIHFRLLNDCPLIELRINKNEQPLKFILDTGAGISVLSQETAEKLGIDPVTKGGTARGIGGDGKFEIVYGFLKSVEIGGVKISSVPIYIRDINFNQSEHIDGYIGLGLLSKFWTTIDYGDQSLTINSQSDAPVMTAEEEKFSQPLRQTSSGFLSGEVKIEGVKLPLNFIVDTGASISAISNIVAGIDSVSKYVEAGKLKVFGAAGMTEQVSSFMLPKLTFGSNTREQVKAIALDLDLINETSGFEQAGILGGNFLKNYRLTFDFKNSSVAFVPLKRTGSKE